MENKYNISSKYFGMLLGLHCGDALGANLEFGPAQAKNSLQTEIVGGGRYNWPAGAATDDTDLAVRLLNSLVVSKGFSPEDFAQSLIEWEKTNPADIGNTTKASIERLKQGVPYYQSGATSENTQTNGSIMRVAPLALLPFNEELIATQAAMTHAHPTCLAADQIFVKALTFALEGKTRNEIFHLTCQYAQGKNEMIFEQLQKTPELTWDELKTSGFVVDTLCSAFWGLMNTDSFEEALIKIINRGDDSDTCGAVTGALCGAYYGLEKIPPRWLEKLQRKNEISELYRMWSLLTIKPLS